VALLPERIEGDGLLLRRWVISDAPSMASAVAESAEHLRPWMPWMSQEPLSLEQRRAMIEGWEQNWRRGGDVALGIFTADGIPGSCGLRRRSATHILEIRYWIHQRWVRQGIATRASRLLTSAAFSIDGIEAVQIRHDKANLASGGVPSKLGFRLIREHPDGTKAPGEVGIECIWRIDRDGWSTVSDSGTATPTARAGPAPR
jgi:ribosomal-protein-serine acetyltransferase